MCNDSLITKVESPLQCRKSTQYIPHFMSKLNIESKNYDTRYKNTTSIVNWKLGRLGLCRLQLSPWGYFVVLDVDCLDAGSSVSSSEQKTTTKLEKSKQDLHGLMWVYSFYANSGLSRNQMKIRIPTGGLEALYLTWKLIRPLGISFSGIESTCSDETVSWYFS